GYTCISNIRNAMIVASPSTPVVGTSTTLSWSMTLPSQCNGSVTVDIQGLGVVGGASGSRTLTLKDTRTFLLNVSKDGSDATLAGTTVDVLPTKNAAGKIDVLIDSDEQAKLFVRSISSEGTE